MGTQACTLPYPNKFHAGSGFIDSTPADVLKLKEEELLLLNALKRQAYDGKCNETKPWAWRGDELTKWSAWDQLGDMPKMEAMRLFIRTLEELQPDWWELGGSSVPIGDDGSSAPLPPSDAASGAPSAKTNEEIGGAPGQASWQAAPRWWAPAIKGDSWPTPRYEHAVAIIDSTMFVVGGNCGGRFLNDTWQLDLRTMQWMQSPQSSAAQNADALPPSSSGPQSTEASSPPPPPLPVGNPPSAGHSLIPWQGSLLSIGGHIKAKNGATREKQVVARVLHVPTLSWSALTPPGNAPAARGSHTATLIRGAVWVFGGEDSSRRPLGDLHVLELSTMTWSTPQTEGPAPPPRSAHAAVAYRDRWLLLFGGGSLVHCFNSVHVLDTYSGRWYLAATSGPQPSGRAGHAGDLVGDSWYLAGGGNNTAGCSDTIALDLSPLGNIPPPSPQSTPADAPPESGTDGAATAASEEQLPTLEWHHVVDVEPRSALATEGLSLVAVPGSAALMAFGGYNGKYHNSVHIFSADDDTALNPDATVTTTAAVHRGSQQSPPAAVYSSVLAAAGQMAKGQELPPPLQTQHPSHPQLSSADMEDVRAQLSKAVARADAAEAAVEEMKETGGLELAVSNRRLKEGQAALEAAQQAAEEARSALSGEQSRAFKLEAQVAELRKALAGTTDTNRDLQRAQAALADAEAKSNRSGKGGILGYITGSS